MTYSKIGLRFNHFIEMKSGHWIVSKVVKSNSHTIIVFEGKEPYKQYRTWLWAADFVPTKYQYNNNAQGIIKSTAINMTNTVGTPGLVRTTHPYGERAKIDAERPKPKYYTLSMNFVDRKEDYNYESWYVPIETARKVQKEINYEEIDGNAPMYQTCGDKSIISSGLRAWCSLFGEQSKSGFNCESWVADKLEKCGVKNARAEHEFIASPPGIYV